MNGRELETLAALINRSTQLYNLCLAMYGPWTDAAGLTIDSERFKFSAKLQKLTVNGLPHPVTLALVTGCDHIRELRLSRLDAMPDLELQGLMNQISKLPQLETLSMYVRLVTIKGYKIIFSVLTGLANISDVAISLGTLCFQLTRQKMRIFASDFC